VEKEANATVPILDENLQIVEAFLEALQLENNVEIVEVKKSVPTTLRTPYTILKSDRDKNIWNWLNRFE